MQVTQLSGHLRVWPVVWLTTVADWELEAALIVEADWVIGIGLQKFKTVGAVRAKTMLIYLDEYWSRWVSPVASISVANWPR